MVQAKQLIWKNKNKEITFKRKKPIILHAYLKKSKQNKNKYNPSPNKTLKNGGHNLLAIDGVG